MKLFFFLVALGVEPGLVQCFSLNETPGVFIDRLLSHEVKEM